MIFDVEHSGLSHINQVRGSASRTRSSIHYGLMPWLVVTLLFSALPVIAQDASGVRVIAFGAHPDDCDPGAARRGSRHVRRA